MSKNVRSSPQQGYNDGVYRKCKDPRDLGDLARRHIKKILARNEHYNVY